MDYLSSSYNPWGVAASFAIASFAAYVALDLSKRVRSRSGHFVRGWWAASSVAMGTGIWSMHFVGMLSLSLPIALGHSVGLTVVSWAAAVGASGVALFIAARRSLGWRPLAGGALAMAAGICAMHYIGMAALDMVPGIVWNPLLVAASALVATAASAVALLLFFRLRGVDASRALRYEVPASLTMGAAICGMHYVGMAAASFPEGSVCLSADALAGDSLGVLTALMTVVLWAMTLCASLALSNNRLRRANDELRLRAFQDPLTGLPNRSLFEDRLMHALQRSERAEDRISERNAEKIAVLFVDLDRFKLINDSLGHAAGDQVLKEAALRLRVATRGSDTVARIGGDEFLVLVEDVASLAECVALARRLVQALARPFEVAGQQIEIGGSVGVVVYPDHGHRTKLIAHADVAMYAAKSAGGNTYALFEAGMDADALEQVKLQNDLRHAIERNQLQLYYQPKIDGRRGQIHGVEALLRWNHPDRGMVSPMLFIPIAERFGLIGSIGNWVIDEACRQMQDWAADGLRMRVAINLSVHQLQEADLAERIGNALARHHVEPSQLLCEITESVAMEDIRTVQQAFEGLARIGVYLSIDDFGTGYSSLSYLRQLPARQLKIDRSFVDDIETSADARAIVTAVVRLAHALSLRVVAEGVETKGQGDILLDLGCDELQGFYFARPMTADALLAWTAGHKPAGKADFTLSVLGEPATS